MSTNQIVRIEPPLGKGEVVSSILTGSTRPRACARIFRESR
jgi:hypothetical protein